MIIIKELKHVNGTKDTLSHSNASGLVYIICAVWNLEERNLLVNDDLFNSNQPVTNCHDWLNEMDRCKFEQWNDGIIQLSFLLKVKTQNWESYVKTSLHYIRARDFAVVQN